MPFQHPEEIGCGYVVERYVTSKDSGRPRYLDLKSRRLLRPAWPHADRFTRPEGLWDQWVNALTHLHDDPAHTPAALRRWTDLSCDFADGWACPKRASRPGGPAAPDVSG